MASHSFPIVDPKTGKVIGIACSRGPRRVPACASCKAPGAKLVCDGCEASLCAQCSVAPTSQLDFCPSCTKPAFDHWKEKENGASIYAGLGRNVGRMEFRAWVKANAEKFNEMVERSEESKREVP